MKSGRISNAVDWLEERTGLPSSVTHFMNEEIPASAGWHQVFGSIALFCFLVQMFTGILLAMNYAPTPGEAYNSVKYIATELTGGRMMRGLHHWGASVMIVVVVLHMIQTFLWGAYKRPREATWIVGVFLLLLTLAYGLTGYLLPWDNRAYWGTVVATQIAASAPGAGPYMTQLLGGEGPIGVVTFARFYAIHVLILPPATMLLIGLHVFLVRKHGVAPAPGDETKPKKKFYPAQVFKDTVAIFLTFAVLFTLAVMVRVPLERLADPTDTSYIPRPDWYFLFLFQMLKLFQGPLEIVGSVVLPGLAVMGLILVPFLDRDVMKRVRHRTLALGVVALAAFGWTGLTVAAIRSTPPTPVIDVTEMQGPESWQLLSAEEVAGIGYYRKEACASCHVGEQKLGTTKKRTREWLMEHLKHPEVMRPGSSMPPVQLTTAQTASLAAFLVKLTPDNASALEAAPQAAVEGAMLYRENQCHVCHQVNGVGMKTGPSLNGVAQRRTRDWLEQHFIDPQKLSPGTTMPAYKFSSRDMDRMLTYIMSIP